MTEWAPVIILIVALSLLGIVMLSPRPRPGRMTPRAVPRSQSAHQCYSQLFNSTGPRSVVIWKSWRKAQAIC